MRPSLVVLVLLALFACAPRAGAQAVPRFAGTFGLPGILCDCEPSDFVFRALRDLPAYAEPDASGRVVRTVARGRLIEGNDWSQAITVVTNPGVAVAQSPVTLTDLHHYGAERFLGTNAGEGEGGATLTLAAGDRVEFLEVDAGFAYIRAGGVVYGGQWPFNDPAFRWEREYPAIERWFHLTPKPGRPAAWVRLDWGEGGNVEMLCNTHELCGEGGEN
ncbi:MAG TPA: hypothetical protein VK610_03885 [Rhodothermales bacterium]|nr:hypothetical protein [Rhodothermales bacterium]